jgi:E3 ubiquitin-protein ligase RGLG
MNPYKSVISILCKTLAPFDDDNLIPTFGFGDLSSKDHSLISFHPDGKPIESLENVLVAYDSLVGSVFLSGPTSFAPAVYKAIEIVRNSGGQYHILVIIADGQVCRASCRKVTQAVECFCTASRWNSKI